jgi:hypothetical protein
VSALLVSILVVLLAVLAAVTGLAVVHRLVPPERRESNNTVAATLFLPVSGLFSVLAAFMIGLGWQQVENARANVQREVNALSEIYWDADALPQPQQQQIKELAQSYAQTMVDEEWDLMGQGEASGRAWSITDDLRDSVNAVEPSTTVEQTHYTHLVAQVQTMLDYRRLRLYASLEGLPVILWAVLLVVGALLISFTYLFGMKHFWVHALMVAAVTVVITVSLLTIKDLEYPFSSPTIESTEPFELVLEGFKAHAER